MTPISRRHFLQTSAVAGGVFMAGAGLSRSRTTLDDVNLGFISCGSRAGQLMGSFVNVPGVNIAGLCDPDEGRLGTTSERFPDAKTWKDLRGLIDDDSIDAVVVATCNHWHCLAAIWAMEAGKDVYVEKPLSHSQWEGRQTVLAARKYERVCQVGTQQRSDPMQAEIKQFLHEEQGIGDLLSARVNRYGVRGAIGKRDNPLTIPPNVDYDLWCGPAEMRPLYRDRLQYDWHWDWNTGSGEMGNWGVHVLDDVRNNVFLDQVTLPQRIFGGGGRVVWNDAGDTPNVHFVYFDTGSIPVVIGLSNLTAGPGERGAAPHPGPGSGYVVYGEGGRFEGQRGRGVAFDNDGREIKSFRGNSGGGVHQQNFIEAVREQDPSMLNTEVEVGHHSTGWCNLANIAYMTGDKFSMEDVGQVDDSQGVWGSLLEEMTDHLGAHEINIESDDILLGPVLTVDVGDETFVGAHSDGANRLLKRDYRDGYTIDEIA